MADFPPLVSMILSNAPSTVIVEAMITILKYVNNVIANPDEQKYRCINMENRTFEEKIGKMKGSIDFLVSVGFIPVGSTLVLDGSTLEISKSMIEAKKLIDKILDKLNVPYDQRPLIIRKDSKEAKKETKSTNFTPKMAMDNMLSSNFDAILKIGLIAIMKYIVNIIAYPEDEKYRTINVTNKTFEEKILPIKGAIEFFYSLQFIESNTKGVPALVLINKSTNEISNIMFEAKKCLDNALDTLQVPEDERPSSKSITANTKNNMTMTSFDPYKPVIARTANQPPRTESITDKKLEELNIRRRKLEGNIENVVRQTLVLLPKVDGSVASIQEYLVDQGPNPEDESSSNDSKIVAKSMMKKIVNSGQEAPLTTKAIRDLEKAQKERVFSQTLIRVKFPDRICIQGYFHPRNTMLDVYEWITECLIHIPVPITKTAVSVSKNKQGEINDIPGNIFELYTTPPKQIFLQNKTLHDLKLVPAAIFHLAWKSKEIEDAIRSKAVVGNAAGAYIHPSLFLQSSSKNDSNGYFPVGEKLIPESNNNIIMMDIEEIAPAKQVSTEIVTASDSKEKAEGKPSTSAPKWLKLEK